MKYALWFAIFVLEGTSVGLAARTATPLLVGARVRANCLLRAPLGLDFGVYNPATQRNTPLDAAGNVLSIQCTKGSPGVSVALDNGESYANSHRNLHDGDNDIVAYEIFTGADHATVWNMTQTVAYVPTSGQPASIAMYGRILPAQTAPHPGRYADTLLAMVNF